MTNPGRLGTVAAMRMNLASAGGSNLRVLPIPRLRSGAVRPAVVKVVTVLSDFHRTEMGAKAHERLFGVTQYRRHRTGEVVDVVSSPLAGED